MASAEEKLKAYVDAMEKKLGSEIQKALIGIPSMERRVLAIRGYLKYPSMGRGTIRANWAWSDEEMEAFKKTAEFVKMKQAVEDVKKTFASQNPGYSLGVDANKVRSLEAQVRLWNQNGSVHKLGEELKRKLLKALESMPEAPDTTSLEEFQKVLTKADLSGSPTNATPGLSQHGQARAFDFVVSKGKVVVAGTVTATIPEKWENPGWTAKLKKAVKDAGDQFSGPLPAPYEPWHYAYKCASAAVEEETRSGHSFSTDLCGTSLRRH